MPQQWQWQPRVQEPAACTAGILAGCAQQRTLI
eukprot:SAG25_NODE_11610_length_300_cov_0.766169_2_plen_32_part_01